MGTITYSQAIKPDTAYIKKIIENSLLFNWAIRIEYLGHDSETAVWQLWEKAFFAIRSARPVMDALIACYEKHSSCAIRIAAENFSPHSRMLYTVYTPHILPDKTFSKSHTRTSNTTHEPGPTYAQISLRA